MQLAVISDTHGEIEATRAAVRMLESLEVDRVLHCGDIGSSAVVDLFSPWPTDFVFGNCDWDRQMLASAIERAGQTCHGVFGDLEIEGKKIALLHSDDQQKFQEVIWSGQWDLVCYGHTHVAALNRPLRSRSTPQASSNNSTLVMNPGAIHRANPPSLAVVELPMLEATIVNL